jgi:hypothetical protein
MENGTSKQELVYSPDTAPVNANAYLTYGLSGANDGKVLKFNKSGQWVAGLGDDQEPLGQDIRLVAQMEYLAIVWRKWQNSAPVDRKVTLVGTGAQPPQRHELGDQDEKFWERDEEGELRDPWQQTHELPLLDTTGGEQYVYSTASRGGIGALSRLSVAYSRNFSRHPGMDPVVTLGASGYEHKIKKFGYIHTPVIKIVDWEARQGAAPVRLTNREMMNDEIPF